MVIMFFCLVILIQETLAANLLITVMEIYLTKNMREQKKQKKKKIEAPCSVQFNTVNKEREKNKGQLLTSFETHVGK